MKDLSRIFLVLIFFACLGVAILHFAEQGKKVPPTKPVPTQPAKPDTPPKKPDCPD